jgi:hypothetical protein
MVSEKSENSFFSPFRVDNKKVNISQVFSAENVTFRHQSPMPLSDQIGEFRETIEKPPRACARITSERRLVGIIGMSDIIKYALEVRREREATTAESNR